MIHQVASVQPRGRWPRYQLPARSPLTISTLAAGVAGAIGQSDARALSRRIESHYLATGTALTGSGTMALSAALRALRRDQETLVALPAYGCYDLATAVVGAGVRAVLYDLDPATLAPEPRSLASALDLRPAAVVFVHLYGIPVDVPGLSAGVPAGTVIIEDAAQAFGASLRGRPAGSFGSLTILSFGRGKGLTGSAGGAVVARDEAGHAAVGKIRTELERPGAGWSPLVRAALQWLLGRPALYGLPAALPFLRLGETIYHEPAPLAPVSRSAIAMVEHGWNQALAESARRRAQAQTLLPALREAGWQTVNPPADAACGYLRLPVRIREYSADIVLSDRARRLGIMRGYPIALPDLPGFARHCVNANAAFPGARDLAQKLITLPTHGMLDRADTELLIHWLGSGPHQNGRHRE